MKSKLWNRNFAILWQGQLISDFGNAAFAVALGFWVLERTGGNTALMGIVEAAFAIPGVLLGPFAGAVADRANRKWIIVAADFFRGTLYTLMGAMLLFDIFPFWVIFPLAILSGACGTFFSPAISSTIPEIVDRENLSKANSARGLSSSLSSLLGNSLGGFLYAVLKAPLLILINGLSFLYASVTQLFMKIPPVRHEAKNQRIMKDMLDGMKYTFGSKGIRAILFVAMFINFFATMSMTLLTPLFNSTPEFGVANYGYMMGCMMLGAVVGMLVFSMVKNQAKPAGGLVLHVANDHGVRFCANRIFEKCCLYVSIGFCCGGYQRHCQYDVSNHHPIHCAQQSQGQGIWRARHCYAKPAAHCYGAERDCCQHCRAAAYHHLLLFAADIRFGPLAV